MSCQTVMHTTHDTCPVVSCHARQLPPGIPIRAASCRYCAVASTDVRAQRTVSATMRNNRFAVCFLHQSPPIPKLDEWKRVSAGGDGTHDELPVRPLLVLHHLATRFPRRDFARLRSAIGVVRLPRGQAVEQAAVAERAAERLVELCARDRSAAAPSHTRGCPPGFRADGLAYAGTHLVGGAGFALPERATEELPSGVSDVLGPVGSDFQRAFGGEGVTDVFPAIGPGVEVEGGGRGEDEEGENEKGQSRARR